MTFAVGNGDCTPVNATGGGDGLDNRVLYLAANPTPGVIGVANYDDGGTGRRDNTVFDTSSRGRKSDPATYPDIAAPGTEITSSCNLITQYRCDGNDVFDLYYSSLTGTSMASPYIAGTAALLLDANPGLTPAQIEYLLEDTAHQFGAADYVADTRNPNHTTSFDRGHGLVDVAAALAVVLERPIPPAPQSEFVADGALVLAFTPDPARTTGAVSPEGCEIEPGQPIGALAAPGAAGVCHSASHGWLEFIAKLPAEFISEPLEQPIVVGDAAAIVAHIADPLRSLASAAIEGRFEYRFDAVAPDDPDGTALSLGAGETLQGLADGRNEGTFDLTATEVPAGYRLRLRLTYPAVTTSAARLLFGGADYGDAGITLTLGHFETSTDPGCIEPNEHSNKCHKSRPRRRDAP